MWNVWVLGYMDRWYQFCRCQTEAQLWVDTKPLRELGYTYLVTFTGALPM